MLVTRKPLSDEVLRRLPRIRVSQARNYLTDHGWLVRLAPRGDMLEFFPEKDRNRSPVPDFFPASESRHGYVEWVENFVRMLSQCEERSPDEIVDDLLVTSDSDRSECRAGGISRAGRARRR